MDIEIARDKQSGRMEGRGRSAEERIEGGGVEARDSSGRNCMIRQRIWSK